MNSIRAHGSKTAAARRAAAGPGPTVATPLSRPTTLLTVTESDATTSSIERRGHGRTFSSNRLHMREKGNVASSSFTSSSQSGLRATLPLARGKQLEYARQLTLFQRIPAAMHNDLLQLFTVQCLSDGQILFKRGDSASSAYLLVRGQLVIFESDTKVAKQPAPAPTATSKQHHEVMNVLQTLDPGASIGETTLELGNRSKSAKVRGKRSYTALAHGDVTLWKLRAVDFWTACEKFRQDCVDTHHHSSLSLSRVHSLLMNRQSAAATTPTASPGPASTLLAVEQSDYKKTRLFRGPSEPVFSSVAGSTLTSSTELHAIAGEIQAAYTTSMVGTECSKSTSRRASQRSTTTASTIARILRRHPCFADLNVAPQLFEVFGSEAQLIQYSDKEVLFRQQIAKSDCAQPSVSDSSTDALGNSLFIVLFGVVQEFCKSTTTDAIESGSNFSNQVASFPPHSCGQCVATYWPGDAVGYRTVVDCLQSCLPYQGRHAPEVFCPHDTTAIAGERTLVLRVPVHTIARVLQEQEALTKKMEFDRIFTFVQLAPQDRTAFATDEIHRLVQHLSFFETQDRHTVNEICRRFHLKTVEPHHIFCAQSEPGDVFYILLSGRVDVLVNRHMAASGRSSRRRRRRTRSASKRNSAKTRRSTLQRPPPGPDDGSSVIDSAWTGTSIANMSKKEIRQYFGSRVVTLSEGAAFGEKSIYTETPVSATVISRTRCTAFVLTKEDYVEIFGMQNCQRITGVDALIQALNSPLHQRPIGLLNTVTKSLSSTQFFHDMPTFVRHEAAGAMRKLSVPANAVLYIEGDRVKNFYLVLKGSVSVFKRHANKRAATLIQKLQSGMRMFGALKSVRQSSSQARATRDVGTSGTSLNFASHRSSHHSLNSPKATQNVSGIQTAPAASVAARQAVFDFRTSSKATANGSAGTLLGTVATTNTQASSSGAASGSSYRHSQQSDSSSDTSPALIASNAATAASRSAESQSRRSVFGITRPVQRTVEDLLPIMTDTKQVSFEVDTSAAAILPTVFHSGGVGMISSYVGQLQNVFRSGDSIGGAARQITDKRTMTVITNEPTELACIPFETFLNIRGRLELMEDSHQKEALDCINKCVLFHSWSRNDLVRALGRLDIRTVKRDEFVVQQGDDCDDVIYVIISGDVQLNQRIMLQPVCDEARVIHAQTRDSNSGDGSNVTQYMQRSSAYYQSLSVSERKAWRASFEKHFSERVCTISQRRLHSVNPALCTALCELANSPRCFAATKQHPHVCMPQVAGVPVIQVHSSAYDLLHPAVIYGSKLTSAHADELGVTSTQNNKPHRFDVPLATLTTCNIIGAERLLSADCPSFAYSAKIVSHAAKFVVLSRATVRKMLQRGSAAQNLDYVRHTQSEYHNRMLHTVETKLMIGIRHLKLVQDSDAGMSPVRSSPGRHHTSSVPRHGTVAQIASTSSTARSTLTLKPELKQHEPNLVQIKFQEVDSRNQASCPPSFSPTPAAIACDATDRDIDQSVSSTATVTMLTDDEISLSFSEAFCDSITRMACIEVAANAIGFDAEPTNEASEVAAAFIKRYNETADRNVVAESEVPPSNRKHLLPIDWEGVKHVKARTTQWTDTINQALHHTGSPGSASDVAAVVGNISDQGLKPTERLLPRRSISRTLAPLRHTRASVSAAKIRIDAERLRRSQSVHVKWNAPPASLIRCQVVPAIFKHADVDSLQVLGDEIEFLPEQMPKRVRTLVGQTGDIPLTHYAPLELNLSAAGAGANDMDEFDVKPNSNRPRHDGELNAASPNSIQAIVPHPNHINECESFDAELNEDASRKWFS
jgi:CRP-like cAMP-binding protein